MSPDRVILDVDAGVDDALGLVLALISPELTIEAITTVNGNVSVDMSIKNVLRVLSLFPNNETVTVYRGEESPLMKKPFNASNVHGNDGLGDLGDDYYPPLNWDLVSNKPAPTLMVELIENHPDEITIIATGPMTNVAKALGKYPGSMRKVKEIVIMGGAIRVPGNIPPLKVSEFNVFADPNAFKMIIDSGLPIKLIPLDITEQVGLTRKRASESLGEVDSKIAKFILECSKKYMDFQQATNGFDGAYFHDALAVGSVINPGLVSSEHVSLCVETDEGPKQGMTSISNNTINSEFCSAGYEVDVEGFLNMFLGRVKQLSL
tara:strand:- start:511 stop:1470 length:960 start_codon:yes stop_codon:yes gene_type:complete